MQEHLDPYSIFDLITSLVIVAERDSLKILFVNDAALKLTRFSQDRLTQLTLRDIYPTLPNSNFVHSPPNQTRYVLDLMGNDGFQCVVDARITSRLIQGIPCVVCTADLVADVNNLSRELQEKDTIYRALITGIFDLFFRIRRDGTYVDFKIPSKTGLYEPKTVDEIIGRNVAEVVPPHVTRVVMPVIKRVIDTGQPESVEYRIIEDSGPHYYDASFAASLPGETVAVVRDITHIKRPEAILRQQRDLSAILSSGISLDEALVKVLNTAITITGMDYGGIYLVDHAQDNALVLVEHLGISDAFVERASYYPPDAPQTQMIMHGEAIYVDYSSMPFGDSDKELPETLRAFAMIPIRNQQEVIGCINLASGRLDIAAIHKTTRDALETIAFHSGSAIVRIRTQEELRESEALARTLLDAPTDTAMLVDRQYRILAINEAGARRFNTTAETMIGTCALAYLPPDVGEKQRQYGDLVSLSRESVTFEDELDGIHFSTTLYPLFDAKGNVSRLAIFTQDVTVEIQTRNTLQKKDSLLEAVAQASNCLLATDDLAVAINDALEIIGKATQADNTYIFEHHVHPESGESVFSQCYFWSKPMRASSWTDIQNQEWSERGLTWSETLRAGDSIVGTLAQFSDPERDFLELFGIKSVLLVPVFIEPGDFWGIIGFDDRHAERKWLPEETSVLRLMGASVGAAIKRQQVEENLRHERKIADTLREVGMVLTSTLDLAEVLELILEQANRVVPYDAANIMLLEGGVGRIAARMGYEKIGLNMDRVTGTTFPIDDIPILQIMLETLQPYLCPDIDRDDKWMHRADALWVKSWLGIPIVLRGKVVGCFSLDSHVANYYTTNHLKLIQPFVKQAAIAFENASLFAETQSLEHIKSEMIRMASHDLRAPLTRTF